MRAGAPILHSLASRSGIIWSLIGLLVLTVLVYLPGLNGPFLFDDPPNIVAPFSAWLAGDTVWQDVVFSNRSGLLGRPISMLSFVVNGATTGLQVIPFKATNLAIHVMCGLLVIALARLIAQRDPSMQASATRTAVLIGALWLLHPIQVSTVLYVVQRMAQLSTLFTLLALLAYVKGRISLEMHRKRAGVIWLWLAVPTATVAAMLSKENGAIVPLLCVVFEVMYFRPPAGDGRPLPVRLFFAAFLALPTAIAIVALLLTPERVLGGYEARAFSLTERLMSQPRALFDYIGALLAPRGPALGVYTDDFVVSRSLLEPPSTLLALVGLIALLALAWRARRRAPAFSAGIGFFLAGHAIESTILPLELYFEHRNYLPSFGIFLALTGLGVAALDALHRRAIAPSAPRLLAVAAALIVAMLSVATWARATTWSSWPALAEQGLQQHPNSMRAHLDHISLLLAQSRTEEAIAHYEHLGSIDHPAAAHVAAFGSAQLACMTRRAIDPSVVGRIRTIPGHRLQLADMYSIELLANRLTSSDCDGLEAAELADLAVDMADRSGQSESLIQIWRTRFVAARLYTKAGKIDHAAQQAALAWMSGKADVAVGIFLANLYLLRSDVRSAQIIVSDVERRLSRWDRRNRRLLDDLVRAFPALVEPTAT